MTSQPEKGNTFKALHESDETFIIPNPWSAGSAVLLEKTGFKALATTSAGFAQAIGLNDGEVTCDQKIAHCRELCAVTSIPVTADFENGFADDPREAADNLMKAAESGLAGGSIEDWSGSEIYDFDLAVERIAACSEAVSKLSFPFMLTARAEGLFRRAQDLDEVIRRLVAFEAAGADVLYAPGLANIEGVKAVLGAVNRPINVLAAFMPEITLAQYNELGVARISVGNVLASAAQKATQAAATQMLTSGTFDWI
jgi:2-methylisocitrate lyase-like PEP mutase family enzyme